MTARLRIVLCVAAFVLAATSTGNFLSWRYQRLQLQKLVDSSGIGSRAPEIAESIQTESDPAWGRISLARAALADQMDQRWMAQLPEAERLALLETSNIV